MSGMNTFWIDPPLEPYVAHESPLYLAIYKPPRMHTVPLRSGEGGTLLDWTAARFPEVQCLTGRKPLEGGFVHRLDYETQGLVLCARTAEALELFLEKQIEGGIIKEYEAVCHTLGPAKLAGFPPPPDLDETEEGVCLIKSAFRPFGKGRKAVRPLAGEKTARAAQTLYETEIISRAETEGKTFFRIRIRKGFRHQIRCHLAWLGFSIVNDPVYGSEAVNDDPSALPARALPRGFLALRARSITFEELEAIKEKNVSIT